MAYEPWMLAAIDRAGCNGIRDDHIDAVAEELLATGLSQVSRAEFDSACRRRGIAPENFRQEDLDRLQHRLNR